MKILVAGGAGFIGSHLIDQLIAKNNQIICVDLLVFETRQNINHLKDNPNFCFIRANLADQDIVDKIFQEHDIDRVYHLAANSDIQKSAVNPNIDFENTFLTTKCLLEGMRKHQVKDFFFASTSAVYGELCDDKLSEATGGIKPVSYYGGAKLASEAFIEAYTAMNDLNTVIFRFPNVIGPRLTHGVIFDFIKKLKATPDCLEILGDGTQCKPYIYVSDLVTAILEQTEKIETGVHIFNVGVETATTVTHIAEIVRDKMNLPNAMFRYTGGNRGWKGDVPKFQYDLTKIHKTGWNAQYTSDEAVEKSVEKALKEIL